jgi:uncharacterized protein involved in exopolysaccharide biosynthesis
MAALKTYEVVDPTLTTPIPLPVASPEVGDPRKQDTIQLLDWYETDAREALARRLDVGRKILAKQVRVSLDERSGVITVEVSDRDPRIAAGVAATLVANLNDFNLRSQQTTSRATREFLEGRLAAVMAELTRAEEDARNFLRVNRRLQDSPTLQLEYSRLQRRVDILQQGYVELASQVEHARSAEVRDTPVITVLQRPTPPARRSSPRRKLIVVGWFLVGSVCAIAWVGARAWLLQYSSSGSTAWSDFVNELSAIRRRDKRSKHPPRG